MARFKPTRGLALAVVAFVARTLGPEIASGSPGPAAFAYHAVNPVRVVDTRAGLGGITMGPGSVLTVALAGAAGGVSADANAVALNVTVVNGSTTSYLTVWPTGASRPDASSLNWSDDAPRANSVTSKFFADGAVSLFNERGTVDVIIDVVGYYETASLGAASSGPVVVDGNGTRIGDLITMSFRTYTALGDDGHVYDVALETGVLNTPGAQEAFLTSDCAGPSKWFVSTNPIFSQLMVVKYRNAGPGQPLFVTVRSSRATTPSRSGTSMAPLASPTSTHRSP